ncbi:hypothetical protein PoB_007051300 [Plakobranchus ocellatus]|uniref:Uncharacterized protein n=1 Tax=Plakobranchus ocellatus TaxID=259542 RepID=A0AAV4DIG0_9GAST|nr:hypothetical protein PoB_007051300 [Plakobranchus ocellatus]
MYCGKTKLTVLLKSMIEECKWGQTRLNMLKDLEGRTLRSIKLQLRSGRKWKVDKAANRLAREGLLEYQPAAWSKLSIYKVKPKQEGTGRDRRQKAADGFRAGGMSSYP